MPAESSQLMIVTGASRGIGAATARLAAARGFRVCVNYLRQQRVAEDVVDTICKKGGTAIAIQADVSSESDVVRLFDSAVRQLGPLTALVNNAGTVERQTRLESIDAARLQIVDVGDDAFDQLRDAAVRVIKRRAGEGADVGHGDDDFRLVAEEVENHG